MVSKHPRKTHEGYCRLLVFSLLEFLLILTMQDHLHLDFVLEGKTLSRDTCIFKPESTNSEHVLLSNGRMQVES